MLNNCRVCKSENLTQVKSIEPYIDYKTTIYDCTNCGCRIVDSYSGVHELLHANPSSYSGHKKYASRVSKYFDTKNVSGLKKFLSKQNKNKFVIDAVEKNLKNTKIADIGCSLGYLSSYFILTGKQVYGYDISNVAIKQAKANFGEEHFYCFSSDVFKDNGPYDVIYHVGTVGCVEDPVTFTKELLASLNPGGVLLFNSPNKKYIESTEELWVPTLPPDLITIFPKEFWANLLMEDFDVSFTESYNTRYDEWHRVCSRKLDNKKKSIVIEDGINRIERLSALIRKLKNLTVRGFLSRIRSNVAHPYGLCVTVKKNGF